MFRESAARPRPTPRLLLVGGLLVLIGVTAGAVTAPGVGPANPPTPAAPLASRPPETTGPVPGAEPVDLVAVEPSGLSGDEGVPADGPVAAPPPPGLRPHRDRSVDLSRSLVFSGLLGLFISVVGLTLVGHRRRLW
ncbi:hypothetical protein [Micromonospora sp. CPCC 206060]|uniref:hypothetical protein n=1 Tax=Micromonospora sp. CPCC 206060 TaxID=3122406 RepID=UPI002FF0E458